MGDQPRCQGTGQCASVAGVTASLSDYSRTPSRRPPPLRAPGRAPPLPGCRAVPHSTAPSSSLPAAPLPAPRLQTGFRVFVLQILF